MSTKSQPRPSRLLVIVAAILIPLGTTACGKKSGGKAGESASQKAGEEPEKPGAAGESAKPSGTAGLPSSVSATQDGDKAATGKQKVLLWHAYRDAERLALDQLIAAWNQKKASIEVVALAVPFDALIDKAQVAIPRGNGPDLVIFAHDKIGTWARDGLIQPLGTWAGRDRLGRFLPQTVKPLVFERAIYGLPLAFKSLVLFYNRTMVPTPPKTMKELIAIAKQHTDKKEGKFGFAYDAADLYMHAGFLHAHGGAVIDEKTGALRLDSDEAIAAAKYVRGLHAKEKVVPKGMSNFVVTAMFNDNKVPMVLNGPWFLSEIEAGIKWAVAPLPTLDNGQPIKPFLGSEAIMLSAKTTKRDAALEVLDYLTSDEAALTRLKVGQQMVANKKVYENARWAADPTIKVFRAQADVAVPMSNAVQASLAWQPYNNALRKIVFGGEDAAKTLKAAQAQADAAVAKQTK